MISTCSMSSTRAVAIFRTSSTTGLSADNFNLRLLDSPSPRPPLNRRPARPRGTSTRSKETILAPGAYGIRVRAPCTNSLRLGSALDHLSEITSFIRLLLSSEQFHLLLVQGPPGWGKSSLTKTVLGSIGQPFRELGSYCTPLALFNGLVADRSGLLLVDDTHGVFQSGLAMSLLNAATWPTGSDGKRTVRWTSTTEKAAADSVDFSGKLIVLTNYLPESPQAGAFKNRALNYRLDVTKEKIGELLLVAAKSVEHFADTKLSTDVARFLGQQAHFHGPSEISLRTLRVGYELASVDPVRWQELLLKGLPSPDPQQVVVELQRSSLKVKDQEEIFIKQTGMQRRKFYYIREQLGFATEVRSRAAKVVAISRARARKAQQGGKRR